MKSVEKKLVCIDLTPLEQKNLHKIAGEKVDRIICVDSDKSKLGASEDSSGVHKDIFLVLIPWRVWKDIPSSDGKKIFFINEMKEELFEQLQCISQCVVGITSEGIEETPDIKEIIDQATDLNNFIHNLREEMELYKTLYLRKSQQLDLLKRMFSYIKEEGDVDSIFRKGFLQLKDMIPLKAMAFVIEEEKYYLHVPKEANTFHNFIISCLDPHKKVSIITHEVPIEALSGNFSEEDIFIVSGSNTRVKVFFQVEGLRKLGEDGIEVLEMVGEFLSVVVDKGVEYKKLLDAAYFDFLTGLGNRHFFDRVIEQEKKRHERLGHSFSILILDIDHFKRINDSYGHDVGDYILKEIGRIIKESVREVDYPIRYGGEEFVIILPHTTKKDAFVLADRLRKRIESHPFTIGGNTLHVTVSIGISEFNPSLHRDIEHILKEADLALYKSKKEGRNRVSVYDNS